MLGQGLHLPARFNESADYFKGLKLFSHRLVEKVDQTTEQLVCSVLVDWFDVQMAGSFQAVDKTTQIISR